MCCNRNNNNNGNNPVLNADQVIIRANRVFVMGAEDNNNHCRNGNVAGAEDYNRGCGNRGNVAGAEDNYRRHSKRCCWF